MADERTITIRLPDNTKGIFDAIVKIAVIGYLIWSGVKTYDVKTLLADQVAPTVQHAANLGERNSEKLDDVKGDAAKAKESADKAAGTAAKIDSTMLKK